MDGLARQQQEESRLDFVIPLHSDGLQEEILNMRGGAEAGAAGGEGDGPDGETD